MDLYLNKIAQSPSSGLVMSLTDSTPREMYDMVANDQHTVNIYLVENGALHADSGTDTIELGFYIGTPGTEELFKQETWPGDDSEKWTAEIDLSDADLLADLGTEVSKEYYLQIIVDTGGSPITYMLQKFTLHNTILDAV